MYFNANLMCPGFSTGDGINLHPAGKVLKIKRASPIWVRACCVLTSLTQINTVVWSHALRRVGYSLLSAIT